MKDLLTNIAAIIVILFCFSLLLADEVPGTDRENMVAIAESQRREKPEATTTLFNKVQSVKMQKGVLIFETLEQGQLQEHFFMMRDKNVFLIRKVIGEIPSDMIKFEDYGHTTVLVTIPATFDIDLYEEMSTH